MLFRNAGVAISILLVGCAFEGSGGGGSLTTSGWQNPRLAEDVDGSGEVTLSDAAWLSIWLDGAERRDLGSLDLGPDRFPDVDGDEVLTSADRLLVLDMLGVTERELALRLSGDVDGDGCVGFGDFLALQAGFGAPTASGPAAGDFDLDGSVGFSDFLRLQASFGECVEYDGPGFALHSRAALATRRMLDVDQAADALGVDLGDESRTSEDGFDLLLVPESEAPVRYPNGTHQIPEESLAAFRAAGESIRGGVVETELATFEALVDAGLYDPEDGVLDAMSDLYFAAQERSFTESEARSYLARRFRDRRGEDVEENARCIVRCRLAFDRRHTSFQAPRGARWRAAPLASTPEDSRFCSGSTFASLLDTHATCDRDYEYDHAADEFGHVGVGQAQAGVGANEIPGEQSCDLSTHTDLVCNAIELEHRGCANVELLLNGSDRVHLSTRARADRDSVGRGNLSEALAVATAVSSYFGDAVEATPITAEELAAIGGNREDVDGAFAVISHAETSAYVPPQLVFGELTCAWRGGLGLTLGGSGLSPALSAGVSCSQPFSVRRTDTSHQDVPLSLEYSTVGNEQRFNATTWWSAIEGAPIRPDRRARRLFISNIRIGLGELSATARTRASASSEVGYVRNDSEAGTVILPYKAGGSGHAEIRAALAGVHLSNLRQGAGNGVDVRLEGPTRAALDCRRWQHREMVDIAP